MKTYGYVRVSTILQDTDKNAASLLKYANDHSLGKINIVSEKVSGNKSWRNRQLYSLVQAMQKSDVLVVPELSRLGRSIVEVLEVLNILSDKGCKVFSVKENFQLNGSDIYSKTMRVLFSLFAEIERDLISQRTLEALKAARAKGTKLGRPAGVYTSRLDKYDTEIKALLKNGSRMNFIAARYGVSPCTLTYWCRRHNVSTKEKPI